MLLSFISGPALPKALNGHLSLSLGNNLIVMGGYSGSISTAGYSASIYKLTCISGKFTWKELEVKLQTARSDFVADFIPN